MKKRLISLFVALTMLLCLIPAAFAATFNAGTYTASANGMNGAVTVEVTFSDSAITDVKVTEQAETPAIASGALEQIPADIVAHQTLAVDTVTGATITSKAILAAVEDCVKQAGADPDTLRTPVEKNTADVGDRTAHVEVLVIGGGGTGLAAAMSAMDSGAKDVMDGSRPMEPVMPLSTTSAPEPAMAITASGPAVMLTLPAPACSNASRSAGTASLSKIATVGTWNFAACCASSSTCAPPAARPVTVKRSR